MIFIKSICSFLIQLSLSGIHKVCRMLASSVCPSSLGSGLGRWLVIILFFLNKEDKYNVRTLAYLRVHAALKGAYHIIIHQLGLPEDWSIIVIKGSNSKKHPQQISAGYDWPETLQISAGPSSPMTINTSVTFPFFLQVVSVCCIIAWGMIPISPLPQADSLESANLSRFPSTACISMQCICFPSNVERIAGITYRR